MRRTAPRRRCCVETVGSVPSRLNDSANASTRCPGRRRGCRCPHLGRREHDADHEVGEHAEAGGGDPFVVLQARYHLIGQLLKRGDLPRRPAQPPSPATGARRPSRALHTPSFACMFTPRLHKATNGPSNAYPELGSPPTPRRAGKVFSRNPPGRLVRDRRNGRADPWGPRSGGAARRCRGRPRRLRRGRPPARRPRRYASWRPSGPCGH